VERVSLAASQDPAETPQSEGRCPRDQAYYASLWSVGHVRLREVKKKGKVLPLYYLEVPGYPRSVFLALPQSFAQPRLGQTIGFSHAPRTDERAVLKGHLYYIRHLEPHLWERAPYFHLRGRLVAVDLEEGRLQVGVRPNPGGKLRAPFTLTLLAPLSLLEALPPVGSGVYLEGEVRPRSGRLVVRRWEPARLWDDTQ
jgi:hypothetical protein